MENGSTTVEILGREYRIRGGADEGYAREVARYVDGKLREVTAMVGAPSPERAAVLAAMNIADELFQLRRAREEDLTRIERKAESLLELLDESLSSGV